MYPPQPVSVRKEKAERSFSPPFSLSGLNSVRISVFFLSLFPSFFFPCLRGWPMKSVEGILLSSYLPLEQKTSKLMSTISSFFLSTRQEKKGRSNSPLNEKVLSLPMDNEAPRSPPRQILKKITQIPPPTPPPPPPVDGNRRWSVC